MINDFNLTCIIKNDVLVITTDGYINNAGEKKFLKNLTHISKMELQNY